MRRFFLSAVTASFIALPLPAMAQKSTAQKSAPDEPAAGETAAAPTIPDTPENRAAMAAGFIEQVPSVPVFLSPVMAATLERISPIQRRDFESAAGYFLRYDYVDQVIFESMAKDFTPEEMAFLTKLLSDPVGRSAFRKLDIMRHETFAPLQGEIYRAYNEARTKSKELKYKKQQYGIEDD